MPNKRVTLLWYCRTPRGWRRFPVLVGKNNRIRHAVVMENGTEQTYPEGRYELRSYEGRRTVYKRAGENAADAMAAREREARMLVIRESAAASGTKLVEESKRQYIRRAAGLYVQDCENRNATEAAEQARLVTDEFMEVCRKTFMDEIVRDDVFRFHRTLRERGCGDRTVANKHERLKSFFRFAGVDVQAVLPPVPRYEATLPTIYTADEIRSILQAADAAMNQTLRLIIEMGLKLGLREQELMHAEWKDVDWQHGTFRVQGKPHYDFKVKDSEQRDIPIPADLLANLKAWQAENPKTRLVAGTRNHMPNQKILRALKRLAKNAKLNCGQCDGCRGTVNECQNWTLHKLRRTYCTTLLRNGLDLKTVQHYAGHADLASTMRYLRPASATETQSRINAIQWT